METAIHADTSVLDAFNKVKQSPAIKHQQSESEKIALLAGDPGFKALQATIDRVINELRERTSTEGSLETVGFKFLACQVAIEQLRYIRNLPEALAKGEHGRKK